MKSIVVEELKKPSIEEQKIEIVERKGLGHPDTICDLIMNEISIQLSREYLKKFGTILHHNIDKALLSAGEVENRFGGGIVKKPMLLLIGDRATYFAEGEEIPVAEISVQTAKEWIKKNMRFLDPEEHIKYQVELKQVSASLGQIFEKKSKFLGANDTSAAVGYAPLSKLEKTVLEVEKFLNSKRFKEKFPETGEDVKVMGLRKNDKLYLTISMAFVDKFIDSEDYYFKRKAEVLEKVKELLENGRFEECKVFLNTLDERGKGVKGLYLTVTGTCADGSDSGQVGRGNRVNGVIPLNRPTSSEAAAGKNPVSHVGKIYNVLSHKIANEIYTNVEGLKEVYVWLLSQIGKPINQPLIAATQVILEKGTLLEDVKRKIEEIIEKELENIDKFCRELSVGKFSIC